ncbi:LOW QUALITY PROTEIN: carbonic anhydrase 14-like [Physella acuta]|uniref:LOW QUALITY PROTEIN: carbonic anhydrase 14-like n=1 Tax=Physella acuta TaxID=109671 RepID=UPI0027DD192A|nr:LOW QUALITY PROTEIN: carbonic anhydrase 14-like [Physella acuta]
MLVHIILFVTAVFLQPVACSDWSYNGEEGVSHWSDLFQKCALTHQSPINIYEGDVVVDPALGEVLFENYDTADGLAMALINNGHTAAVSIAGARDVAISGGDLPHKFKANQLHFHWGSHSSEGSEHQISSQTFPMELHIVHYNTKYPDFAAALSQGDGLAVLGFVFKISKTDNPALSQIVSSLASIRSVDTAVDFKPFAIKTILPESFHQFYRYSGSLTTPPCDESVTWTVYKEPINISEAQITEFRTLQDHTHSPINLNARPVQPLNDRVVKANFDPNVHWGYYHGESTHWRETFSNCGAYSQSPINIEVFYTVEEPLPVMVYKNYETSAGVLMKLKNSGHAAQVDISGTEISISGSGLTEPYVAAQFQFHWGGSEHTINGKSYPMELHIVHYKKSLGSLAAAATQFQGLAVLGFLFEVSSGDNVLFNNITNYLKSIKDPDTSVTIPSFPINSILPSRRSDLYRYHGSLTTPGCHETVIWSVFKDTIQVSSRQLALFRTLVSHETDSNGNPLPMVDNNRPIQAINSREVYRNF